jgi:hypothetical protein
VELSYLRTGPTEIAGQARQMHMMDTLHQLHQHARHVTTSVLENPYLMGGSLGAAGIRRKYRSTLRVLQQVSFRRGLCIDGFGQVPWEEDGGEREVRGVYQVGSQKCMRPSFALVSRALFFRFGAIFPTFGQFRPFLRPDFSHFGEFLISTHVIQAREMVA